MKRKIILSIALVLSVAMLSLMKSDSTAQAQTTATTIPVGFITIGENHILRLTVNAGAGNDTVTVRFREQEYMPTGCNGGVCKYAVSSQEMSPPITLMPGEAASFDFRRCVSPICGGVRGAVLSNSRNVQVNVLIIDRTTGEVVAFDKHWEIIQLEHG